MEDVFPEISTAFQTIDDSSIHHIYFATIKKILKKILPKNFSFELNSEKFHQIVPLVKAELCEKAPGNISFFVLSRYRQNAFKFFFELISSWLIPGKRLNVVLIYAADFKMPTYSQGIYTICEVIIQVESNEELLSIKKNLPTIETEILLGIESQYYARRILEVKGMKADSKTASIQEDIAYILKKYPTKFTYELLTEMQHLLVITRDEFKAAREYRHLTRIVVLNFLFRQHLKEVIQSNPGKRFITRKLFLTKIQTEKGKKTVLAVLVGVNFLKEKEFLDKSHLVDAIKKYVPEAQAVSSSFFLNKKGSESVSTFYLEMEKSNQQPFTIAEIKLLKEELPNELRERISQYLPPVFMPKNEEEIMRNVLSLSSQLKYITDHPQAFITFEKQTEYHLYFTVLVVRVLQPGVQSLQEMFKSKPTSLQYIHDRCKSLGLLAKKYTKEATVFSVFIDKSKFLRSNQSIDLGKARQEVVSQLELVIGKFRDYNGGLLSKQNQTLENLKECMDDSLRYTSLQLENFFFSLTPVRLRTILDPKILKKMFVLLVSLEGNEEEVTIEFDDAAVYLAFKTENMAKKESIEHLLIELQSDAVEIAQCYLEQEENHLCGFILLTRAPDKLQLVIKNLLSSQTVLK